MGSIVMEPGDIISYTNAGTDHTLKNLTTLCLFANRIHPNNGVFAGENPLEFSTPLLFLQLAICSGTIILFSQLLKPLGQPLIVSQILGGLVLGSSGLSHLEKFKETVFPLRGFIFLDVVSALGHIFYFFLIGLQTDMSIVRQIDRKAISIGSGSTFLAVILVTIYSITLIDVLDFKTLNYTFALGQLEAIINFPMVSSLLHELRLINSEFGRIALSTSMASTIISIGFSLLSTILAPHGGTKHKEALSKVFGIVVLTVIVTFVFRRVTLWMITKNPIGQPLKEFFVITLLLGVLVVAFCCQALGLQIYFGPFFLGFILPYGPPIGSTLVERLDFITSWIFMPIFFAKIGLVVNIYTIKIVNFLYISFIVLVSAFGKFFGALMISIYYKLTMRDAVSLGLILNSQGALELGMFKIKRREKIIDEEEFVVGCICMLIIVAIITPIIRYLLDHPSRSYIVHGRRTVMHSRSEFDLCLLVCIHDEEDVPSAINILHALNPTRRSHLIVYMLHLIELVGRAQPKLIHHTFMKNSRTSSEPIVNAFKYFGEMNREVVAINPFTTISPFATIHDDVCSLALNKKSSLILVPFHKRFYSNGVMSSSKQNVKMVNQHILNKAPCSIAIVVERRGYLKVTKSVTNYNLNYSFQIGIVFIGGADDREAMFIGARMVGHPNINLTMYRVLDPSGCYDVEERRLDNEAVVEFQQIIQDNCRVRYIEEVVKDGTGTICILRSMGSNNFDLVMVGRRHNPSLASVQGLVFWNECTELGAIGEVLASSDFMGNAIILVVQQHIGVGNDHHQQTVISMDNNIEGK